MGASRMNCTVVTVGGDRTDGDSVEAALLGMNGIASPDLDNRLDGLRCPAHGSGLERVTIHIRRFTEEQLSAIEQGGQQRPASARFLIFEFTAGCTNEGICDAFNDEVDRAIDQDQERATEFLVPGEPDSII